MSGRADVLVRVTTLTTAKPGEVIPAVVIEHRLEQTEVVFDCPSAEAAANLATALALAIEAHSVHKVTREG